jgi:hypothetical protein
MLKVLLSAGDYKARLFTVLCDTTKSKMPVVDLIIKATPF